MKLLPVLVFAVAFISGPGTVRGQVDPLPPEARRTADRFIELLDAGKYRETHGLTASMVTDTAPVWHGRMKSHRDRMGEVKSRVLNKAESVKDFAGLPRGDYKQITYATSFAEQAETSEIVLLHKGQDSRWGIAGYEVQYDLWPEALRMMGSGLLVVFFIMILLATITWSVGKVLQRTTEKEETEKEETEKEETEKEETEKEETEKEEAKKEG